MPRIHLEAAADHVEQLAHEREPVRAVVELIWNSLDADANHVTVTIERDQMDAVQRVTVVDDGHGMPPEAVETAFKRIGGSWKKNTLTTQVKHRPVHGKTGQGRLRAFALGGRIRWTTTADDTAGVRYTTTVSGSDAERSGFDVSEPATTSYPVGTVFEAMAKQSPYINRLTVPNARHEITSALAPHLLALPEIEVVYDGLRLDPASAIAHDQTYELGFEFEQESYSAHLRVIEWKSEGDRKLYLCDENWVPVEPMPAGVSASDFLFSAYLSWDGVHEHRGEMVFGYPTESPLSALIAAARERLEEHFEGRRIEQRRRTVDEWKQQDLYPYIGETTIETELVERATFDVVATAIQRAIPKQKTKKKLALNLIKDSLRHNPDGMYRILDSVLKLTPEEKEQLERLLDRTSLSNIIKASANIANRLDFVRALEQMVYDPEANELVKERLHLHKILERELWVFGEEYNMMASEVGLSTVLDRHLEKLGRVPEDKQAVRMLDGRLGRVDLMLSAAAKEHDRSRHLVVELKGPKITAHHGEERQIKQYANAVATDPRFASDEVHWDFWLVVSDVDDEVRESCHQDDREPGLVHNPQRIAEAPRAHVRVWIKTWGEIITECQRRLNFIQRNLRHDPTIEHALEYLNRECADLLPDGLRREQPT